MRFSVRIVSYFAVLPFDRANHVDIVSSSFEVVVDGSSPATLKDVNDDIVRARKSTHRYQRRITSDRIAQRHYFHCHAYFDEQVSRVILTSSGGFGDLPATPKVIVSEAIKDAASFILSGLECPGGLWQVWDDVAACGYYFIYGK